MGLGSFFPIGKSLFGGTSAEKKLSDLSKAYFESSDIQRYLPPSLRTGNTEPIFHAGIAGIGDLVRNPGGLSPGVADAIRPRLAAESQTIAQNFRGIGANQAGAAARGNLPVSIKAALEAALNTSQERAQRGARGEALMASETLRREDLERIYPLLQAILQFTGSRQGQGLQAGSQLAQSAQQRQAATIGLISSLIPWNIGGGGGGGGLQ